VHDELFGVIVSGVVAPAESKVSDVGENVNVQEDVPVCVTVIDVLPIVTWPILDELRVLDVAVTFTDPFPVPEVGDSLSQDESSETVHVHDEA
jgi:hypothetical protein